MKAHANQLLRNVRPNGSCRLCVSFFTTEFGWFGLWGNDDGVAGLTIGHASADSATVGRLPH